jgi:hypothetical protein
MMNYEREKILLRYTEALLNGDWDEQELILQAIVNNSELENAILNLHQQVGQHLLIETQEAYIQENEQSLIDVRTLLESHFEGRVLDRPEDASAFSLESLELLPVTVAEVANRLRSEVTGREIENTNTVLSQLAQNNEPLPEVISPRQIRALLSRLGIDLGRWFEQRFHEAAFYLESGRQEQRLIAARRIRERQQNRKGLRDEENAS